MEKQSVDTAFFGKNVLITGNTGFKGAWLSILLQELGAEVFGLSLNADNSIVSLKGDRQFYADVRNFSEVNRIVNQIRPDFVYHLAADAITLSSFEHPRVTFETNVIGTINMLEAMRLYSGKCSVVVASSDKCYENNESIWAFREVDRLGGKDPYSASKSMTEMAVSSYHSSFFLANSNISVVSCRAGNVVGGGDWGLKRIVPDSVRAWLNKEPVFIRNPKSRRPWSYVLDIVFGYALAGVNTERYNGQAFNIGASESPISVEELIIELSKSWPDKSFKHIEVAALGAKGKEAVSLKLDCEKARIFLGWIPIVPLGVAVKETVNFYSQANQGLNTETLVRRSVRKYLKNRFH